MAAPMKNAVRNFCRPILGNVHKLFIQKQYIPVSKLSRLSLAVSSQKELKFDVSTLESKEPLKAEETHEVAEDEPKTFAAMFRNSKFVQLGDLKDKTFAGRIFHIVNDDLYIDFGGKFYCVCPRPAFQADQYVKGQRVRVMVHKTEMTSSFMGSDQHLTLLEADATLMGLFDQLPRDKVEKTTKDNVVAEGFADRRMSKESNDSDVGETVEDLHEITEKVENKTETVGIEVSEDNSVKSQ